MAWGLDIVSARCLLDETLIQRGQLVATWALKGSCIGSTGVTNAVSNSCK